MAKIAPAGWAPHRREHSRMNPIAATIPVGDGAAARDALTFDFAALSPRERYKLLIGAVVPRPIALVTSVDAKGRVNAAPFSFFNCLSADPPILALGVEYRSDGRSKDTGQNVKETREFTVNIVSHAMMQSMNNCAIPFDPSIDELQEAGFTQRPGVKVACPGIAESPAVFECRHYITLGIGNSREIILGEVVQAHIRADAVDKANFHVHADVLDAVGRMGGHGYVRANEVFDLPTIGVAEWLSRSEV
jgi:flavin reductase (DIM6/NTAB) family NADH-FMN oxidoreductase RutF